MNSENYFALDLELNKPRNNNPPKIIQVGVAIGNITYPEDDIISVSWYLNPEEPIDPEITKLTGITDSIINEKSVSHETVASQLGSLLRLYDVFTNPIVWGGTPKSSDAEELLSEFREREIQFPFFGRRIVDVKTIYVFLQTAKGKTKSGGLRKAMSTYGLDFIGTPHNAEDDAQNTLRFFFHLAKRQKIFDDYVSLVKEIK